MVTQRNLVEIVRRLLTHLEGADGHYRDELIRKILFVCSRDRYYYLTDFAWYITVLVNLSYIKGSAMGSAVAEQLLDVCLRVESVRPFAVRSMVRACSFNSGCSVADACSLALACAAAAAVRSQPV